MVFACAGSWLYVPVDGKPKSGKPLLRVRNIAHEPRVSLLVDHYAEDWTTLWWVRVDGHATVTEETGTVTTAHELLRAKYPQYATVSLEPTVIAVRVARVATWSADG